MNLRDKVYAILKAQIRFYSGSPPSDSETVFWARKSTKPENAFQGAGDSIDQIEFVISIEREFDIEISITDAARLISIQSTVDYLLSIGIPNE